MFTDNNETFENILIYSIKNYKIFNEYIQNNKTF